MSKLRASAAGVGAVAALVATAVFVPDGWPGVAVLVAVVMISGVSTDVVQTLVTLNIDLTKLDLVVDLQSALDRAGLMLDNGRRTPKALISPISATAAT